MTQKAKLKNGGVSRKTANAILGTVTTGLTATGNASQTGGLYVTDDINVITTAGATTNSITLPNYLGAGESITVCNYTTGQTLNIYPPVGGKIRGGATNAAITLASPGTATLICIDNLNFI